MSDKVGLITGGARGIGRAIALALAYQGWSIALCYRTSEKEAVKIVNEIEQKGSRGLRVRCDVSDPEAAQAFVKHVENEWGHIDALINCAGPYHRVNLLEETIEGCHSMFDNNLPPVFSQSRAVEKNWVEIIIKH